MSDDKPTAKQLLERDDKHILRPWSAANEPVPIVTAKGSTVTDADGKAFIDFTSGYFVNQAGHSHPRVIEAAKRQLDQVSQVSGRHTTPPLVDLAEKLVQLTPASVDKVFFTTAGSESNEFALKMVRQKTGKTDVAVLDNAFHGLTLGALAGCGSEKYRATAGVPMGDYVYKIPTAYCYRCPVGKDPETCVVECLDEAEVQFEQRPATVAVLAEPVQSVGGLRPPNKWWARLDDMRRKRGLYLILDEIQTGIGRTGKMFAAEHYGLEPDILTTAKGLSGGVGSMGAVVLRGELGEGFFAGTTPTNGGNAISAAAGLALIQTLEDEGIVEHCAKMGEYFTEAVARLDDPWVGDIRFTGLLGGVELVADRDSKQPLGKPELRAIHDSLHEQGMLTTVSGPLGNVLRLQPPLVVTADELDRFVEALRVALHSGRESSKSM